VSEIVFDHVSFTYPEGEQAVFTDLSITLPAGVGSLIGQNGTGKSTFLLLAGGSLVPDEGRVLIDGVDTRQLRDERERQRYVSFIFQNMEFETDKPIGELLQYVYQGGFHAERPQSRIDELVEVFELRPVLSRRTQEVSKGELQRTILAFCLLYGSRVLLMDEPIFALEAQQKERAMAYLGATVRAASLSLYYSVHELDISEKYSDWLIVFHRSGLPRLGPTRELFTREVIEQAYEAPLAAMKQKEALYREVMKQTRGMLGG
jgi:ABC-type cobalamin/Fe3+-siderophores transport system ATPase subunit